MIDNIIFDLNTYFGYSAIFAARCAHFAVSSGRRDTLFFLSEQMYISFLYIYIYIYKNVHIWQHIDPED